MAADIEPRRQVEPVDQVGVDDLLAGMHAGALAPEGDPEQALHTAFDPLDKALEGGFRRGDLSIIGGMPGVGKTIATLQWATTFAKQGANVLYHCYEHDVPSMFGRVLSMECGSLDVDLEPVETELVRSAVDAIMQGDWDLDADYASVPVVRAALAEIDEYAAHLTLSQVASATADIEMIRKSVAEADEKIDVVFVDYLQKVPVPGLHGIDRFSQIVESLKNLAVTEHCHVVAVSAVGEGALDEQRLHLEGLRGAHVLAHEADVIIALNRKLRVVAKAHLAFDSTLAARFARTIVFTIEKNRRGLAPLDLEFDTDFSHFRFDPRGRFVAERLVGGVSGDE